MNYFQKKSAGLALCTLVSASSLFAQQSITGTVKDASGPVSGVTVTVKGTSRATQTTANGSFTIQASQGETLRIFQRVQIIRLQLTHLVISLRH